MRALAGCCCCTGACIAQRVAATIQAENVALSSTMHQILPAAKTSLHQRQHPPSRGIWSTTE